MFAAAASAPAQEPVPTPAVPGIFPKLTSVAGHVPRTECGIGAVMPWADRLWYVSYLAHAAKTGTGTGLYSVDDSMHVVKHPESRDGTYANRLIHKATNLLLIGPHTVDPQGNVKTIEGLVPHRLGATAAHLTDPDRKAYYLTMEGLLLEADVVSFEVKEVADLKKELGIRGKCHFKAAHTAFGRLVVANNSYWEEDEISAPGSGYDADGRLAEWDGKGPWRILERTAFVEAAGNGILDDAIVATGWDRASAILKIFTKGAWSTWRLPKGSHTYDHAWFTEWERAREAETERLLLDVHGIFYEMPAMAYGGKVRGIRPIAAHLRMVPDFCSWRGMLVLAGDQTSSMQDKNAVGGQPQSNLWFGKTDDLWSFGKPQGWGGPWRDTQVKAGEPSVPYLMTGFDKKGVHFWHDAAEPVTFTIEVDPVGDGSWKTYAKIAVPPGAYEHHEFPAGFGAHWARVTVDRDCKATAWFVYP